MFYTVSAEVYYEGVGFWTWLGSTTVRDPLPNVEERRRNPRLHGHNGREARLRFRCGSTLAVCYGWGRCQFKTVPEGPDSMDTDPDNNMWGPGFARNLESQGPEHWAIQQVLLEMPGKIVAARDRPRHLQR